MDIVLLKSTLPSNFCKRFLSKKKRCVKVVKCYVPFYHSTILPFYHSTILPLWGRCWDGFNIGFFTWLNYHFTILPFYHSTILPFYHFTILPFYHFTILPFYHYGGVSEGYLSMLNTIMGEKGLYNFILLVYDNVT